MSNKNSLRSDVEYLNEKLNPILSKMTISALRARPEDVVDFMLNWLLVNASIILFDVKSFIDAAKTPTMEKFLARCIDTQAQIKKSPEPVKKAPTPVNKKAASESKSATSSGSEDESIDELPKVLPKNARPRNSVSAEPMSSITRNFKARVIPKSEEQKRRIQIKLSQSFLFQALEDKDRETVVNAMEEKTYRPDDWVIKQGEDGDTLYVVDEGLLDCYKRFTKDGENKYLKTYKPGESFGELALLYNVPRAASIKAKTESVLFCLDRECFNGVVRAAAMKKRERYENFLAKVKLLEEMDAYERLQLSDAFSPEKFSKGDYIIRQGQTGDKFYFIEEGTAVATKLIDNKEQEVYKYKPGDYFGELALLNKAPRAANIVATSELLIVSIDHDTFQRVLGPLQEIMKRNMDKYILYQQKGK